MTALVMLAAATTALAVILVPFAVLINCMPLQRLLLLLVGTTGGSAPRFSASEALQRVGALLRYLALRAPLPGDGFYSAVELAHMTDVQALFQAVYAAALASSCIQAIALIFLARRDRNLALAAVRTGSIADLVLVAVLGTAVLTVGFDQVFVTFHELVFTNSFWLLPEDSSLISLFPEDYFMGYFCLTLAASVLLAVFLTLLSFRRRQRRF